MHLFQLLELRPGLTTMQLAAREICGAANQRRLELTMDHIAYTQEGGGLSWITLDEWAVVRLSYGITSSDLSEETECSASLFMIIVLVLISTVVSLHD